MMSIILEDSPVNVCQYCFCWSVSNVKTGESMFTKKDDGACKEPASGIKIRTAAYGEKTLMTEFSMKKGSILSDHSHPHEQTGYLVSGHMKLIVGDEVYDTAPGDSWSIPGDVKHGAEVLEDSVGVEVFSPVREDYLP